MGTETGWVIEKVDKFADTYDVRLKGRSKLIEVSLPYARRYIKRHDPEATHFVYVNIDGYVEKRKV